MTDPTMLPIHAEGLTLRTLEEVDAPALVQAARESLDTVGRWMPWCTASYSEKDALDFVADCRSNRSRGTAYDLGIFEDGDPTLVGIVGLNSIDLRNRFCNLGYWVRNSRQRRGIAFRCLEILARYAFEELNLFRVEIVVAVGNTASDALALKAGALAERVARNRIHIRGTSVPATVYSLIP
jgi:RimJ/RimL family protein N-acetyltransferase